MRAVAFTGLARSGKDTAADYLAGRYGYRKLVLSEVAAKELKEKGMQDSKMNRSLFIEEMRKTLGKDILARRVVAEAKKNNWEKAVFTGVHQAAEVEFFRENIEKFLLVAVKASDERRYGRKTGLDAQTRNGFFGRDEHDLEKFELGKVIGMADATIENNTSITDLKKALDALVKKFGI